MMAKTKKIKTRRTDLPITHLITTGDFSKGWGISSLRSRPVLLVNLLWRYEIYYRIKKINNSKQY